MVDIYACDQLIEIGRQQENEYRRVRFPMADVLGQYPDATFNVLNRRSADMSAYVVPASQISVEGTDVCWVLKASDLAYIGDGECEVIAYSGNTVAKDEIYTVRVLAALDEGMDPPDPSWDEYLADLSAIADRAETAETGSAENALKAEGYAVGRQNGEPVDQESPYYHGHAAYFAGEAGVSAATAAGSAGEAAGSASAAGRSAGSAAGSAAAAETAQIKAEEAQAAAESARDQITGMTAEATTLDPGDSATASYSDGVLSLGIPRGADGQDGEDGRDGADGYSPSAVVSKSGSTATITITDKTGTTTAEISDGQDGQDGADGYTPQRGVDYWTAEDQAVIISAVEEDVGEDISELKSEIDRKAPVIYQDASGDIVSFADGADGMPLSACSVSVDPVQDLHGQANPYPAGGGPNLFDPDNFSEYIVNGDARNGHEYTTAGTYAVKAYGSGSSAFIYARVKNSDDSWGSVNYVVSNNTATTGAIITLTSGQTLYVYDAQGHTESVSKDLFNGWKIQVVLASSQPSTFAPYSNICPITGHTGANVSRTGRNLLPKMTGYNTNGLTATVNDDGSIKVSGTATGSGGYITNSVDFPEPIPAGVPITIGVTTPAPSQLRIFWNGGGTADIAANQNSFSVVTAKPTTGFKFYLFTTANTAYNFTIYPQVNIGLTALPYTPYVGTVYPISWQTAAGTVYGGNLTVHEDGTGTLIADKGYFTDNGTANWQRNQSGSFYLIGQDTNVATNSHGLCNYSPYVYSTTAQYSIFARPQGQIAITYGWSEIWPTVDALKAAFAQTPLQVVYPLANPITYDLTAAEVGQILTLKGYNALWADTGAVAVTYPADTRTYVDSAITAATDPDGNVVTVTGSTPSITGESGKRYVCGTVDSISITPPGTGIIDVVFTSGTTPTVLTVPSTVRFPAWFNPASLDASTRYEINIMDGTDGAVMAWQT